MSVGVQVGVTIQFGWCKYTLSFLGLQVFYMRPIGHSYSRNNALVLLYSYYIIIYVHVHGLTYSSCDTQIYTSVVLVMPFTFSFSKDMIYF